MSLHRLSGQFEQSFSKFWSMRDSRERKMLSIAAVVVLLAVVYAILIAPALSGRKQLNKNLPILRLQVAQLQELSKRASELSGQSVPIIIDISREDIEAALARNSLRPKSLQLTGDYVKIQLSAVSFASTLSWFDDMQATSQFFVVDAKIIALAQPDKVDVTATLRRAGNK